MDSVAVIALLEIVEVSYAYEDVVETFTCLQGTQKVMHARSDYGGTNKKHTGMEEREMAHAFTNCSYARSYLPHLNLRYRLLSPALSPSACSL